MLDRFFDGKLAPFIETNKGVHLNAPRTGNDYFNKINMFSAERINAEIDYIGKKACSYLHNNIQIRILQCIKR